MSEKRKIDNKGSIIMKKELIITISIIIFIIVVDIILEKYTTNSMNLISDKLSEVKYCLDNKEQSILQIKDINNEWDNRFKILTFYLEHDELEKVKTQLVVIEAGIQIDDYECAYEEADKAIYILDHLKDKQRLKFENFF